MRENKDITVLVVDDEQEIADLMEMNFELDGFKVLKASGGRAALEIVKTQKIDFVLSDVRMPEGDGFTLLQEIKKLALDLPVVLLITGFSEVSREEVIKNGGIDLFMKPVDLELIFKVMKDCLNLK